ncbi:MAG TPA: TonB-dependent receptor [Flavihumibacter sp.]
MKKIFLMCMALGCALISQSQYALTIHIKSATSQGPLPGTTVRIVTGKDTDTNPRTAIADSVGSVRFENLAKGLHNVLISHVGFEEKGTSIEMGEADQRIEITLEEAEEQEPEVVVTATRISRTIGNVPTRVELISGEELEEKANMKPGEIRMMLTESTGIQTQQTSATSFNAGIRIQGLDGRYTQLLRDGYPLYSGFSGGLSILQIAPLDLRQVEVIKGAASTLYGGGAIAGLVNLVSKTPTNKREISFLANGTSAGGLDLSGFYSERYGKTGLTIFASRNSNRAYDPADIGLTAIPKFERYTINPRLFIYGKKTTADIGVSYITEDRTGGSLDYIKHGGTGFFEKNNTDRITFQTGIRHKLNESSSLQLKNSYSRFDRIIAIPDYRFAALQQASFSELTWNRKGAEADWVIGANLITDDLVERGDNNPRHDYHYSTYGLFIQNAWTVTEKLVLETGLRGDYVRKYGFELLPRISAMILITPQITTRIGGGYGYKTPTIFTEDAERLYFRNILPIDINSTRNERSVGANADINYRTRFGDLGFSINHLFYYTRLNNPLVLLAGSANSLEFKNSDGYLDTKGMETNIRLTYGDFKLFIGYTYTDAHTHFNDELERLTLTARHRLNNVLMYEVEEKWKIGLEAYWFSKQKLSDGNYGKPYWITGCMIEKLWEKFSIYINFENFTDTRQTRFDTIFTGSVDNPVFRDIYAPVDGFIINGGVKIKL